MEEEEREREGEGERKRGRKSGREGERDAKGNNNL